MAEGAGRIKLGDGTELELRIMILDIREAGFSPFGGVNFSVKAMGGIATKVVPEELRRAVADKPTAPQEPPQDGWELVDIVDQHPAIAEESINSSRGRFTVRVAAEATMVARNLNYRVVFGDASEPLYWATWVYKITWKPEVRGE
jgi:hypothetical protein